MVTIKVFLWTFLQCLFKSFFDSQNFFCRTIKIAKTYHNCLHLHRVSNPLKSHKHGSGQYTNHFDIEILLKCKPSCSLEVLQKYELKVNPSRNLNQNPMQKLESYSWGNFIALKINFAQAVKKKKWEKLNRAFEFWSRQLLLTFDFKLETIR